MKKAAFFLCTIACLSGVAEAESALTTTPRMSLGIDTALPYVIQIDGDAINARSNLNMGIDYRYFASDDLNVGLRYAFDVETRPGTTRQQSIAPGIQYQWFQGHTWMPYFRSDIPFVFNAAPASTGKTDQEDAGISVGSGIGWNLGNQIGIDHLVVRYDFNITYYFGFWDALNLLSIDFFRFGMDYRF